MGTTCWAPGIVVVAEAVLVTNVAADPEKTVCYIQRNVQFSHIKAVILGGKWFDSHLAQSPLQPSRWRVLLRWLCMWH